MRALKTIVATAVIVFAMTSVAMAGVQQLTTAQDAQAVDKTRANCRITLTDKQPAQHVDHQSRIHVREAQKAKTHARRVERKHAQARERAHEDETSPQTHVSTGDHVSGHAGGHGGD
jgi:hypothetical protein